MFVPCCSCGRHVRVDERTCPFCRALVPPNLASRPVPEPTRRLGRAAIFVFASAATGVVAPACAKTANEPASVATPPAMPMASYGGPPTPAAPAASACDDAGGSSD